MLKLMFISAMPIVELRGGIPAGVLMDLPLLTTYALAVIGNMIPVPFIILLWKKALAFFQKTFPKSFFTRLLEKIQFKADEKKEKVLQYEKWGLFIFVAVPLPGTGAWTGALIAATLRMRLRDAIWPILAGVLMAGAIMTVVSYGGLAAVASLFA